MSKKFDHVPDGGTAGTGDDPNALREARQHAFSLWLEIPLGEQFLLELPQGEFGRADALRLNLFDEELVIAARFVNGEPAAGQNFEAVSGIEP